MIQEELYRDCGVRDAVYHLEDALYELHGALLAQLGWSWEVWFAPTERGRAAFGWWERRICGPYTCKVDADEAWYMEQCEHRISPDADDYSRIELRAVR